MKIYFVVVVWGQSFLDMFLNTTIPNYLSPNNLPACSGYGSLAFQVYTRPGDLEFIRRHRSYQALANELETELIPALTPGLIEGRNKWDLKGLCQSMAIRDAQAQKAVVVLLNPDSLISDGGLATCCALIRKGNKAVLVLELARALKESAIPALRKEFYDTETNVLNLPNRRLVAIGVENLHPTGQILFWKDTPFSGWPSVMYWRAGRASLLAKSFNLHPLAIDLRDAIREVPTTLMPDDAGLIEWLGITRRSSHVVTDSDEIACVELSSIQMDREESVPSAERSRTFHVLSWARRHVLPGHRDNFSSYSIRFRGENGVDWDKIESQAKSDTRFLRLLLPLAIKGQGLILRVRLILRYKVRPLARRVIS